MLSFMSIGTMVIGLREFNKKNKMGNFGQKCIYSVQFGIQLSCDMHCAVKMKLKVRTEFPNVWGEYKYHGNPCSTVPCDVEGTLDIKNAASVV